MAIFLCFEGKLTKNVFLMVYGRVAGVYKTHNHQGKTLVVGFVFVCVYSPNWWTKLGGKGQGRQNMYLAYTSYKHYIVYFLAELSFAQPIFCLMKD